VVVNVCDSIRAQELSLERPLLKGGKQRRKNSLWSDQSGSPLWPRFQVLSFRSKL
jgi:hypothetical protein